MADIELMSTNLLAQKRNSLPSENIASPASVSSSTGAAEPSDLTQDFEHADAVSHEERSSFLNLARIPMTDGNRVYSATELLRSVEADPVDASALAAQDNKPSSGYTSTSTPGIILEAIHYFFMSFPVQICMVLLTIIDIIFLIYEFASNRTRFEILTMVSSTLFQFEVLASLGHLQRNYFIFERNWVIGEVSVVTASFIVEYSQFILKIVFFTKFASWIAYLRAIRFLRVLIVWKTRSKKLSTALRRLVSADRRRLEIGGYDLDLTYVNNRVIAMSWPSDGLEGLYRNNIDQVAQYLNSKHPNSYLIFNLCSERAYDESKFGYRVHRYKCDDHNPGALHLMVDMALDVDAFLRKSPENVVIIHCKGGKGRTGTMICTHFLYSGFADTAEKALLHFGKQRTSDDAQSFQGVESPSQARFVEYFAQLVQRARAAKAVIALPPAKKVRITKIRLHYVPLKWWDVNKLWFCVIQNPSGSGAKGDERIAHYISNPTVMFNPNVGAVKHKHGPKLLSEEDTAAAVTQPSASVSNAATESHSLLSSSGARAHAANVVAYYSTVPVSAAAKEQDVFGSADSMRAVPLDSLRSLKKQLEASGGDATADGAAVSAVAATSNNSSANLANSPSVVVADADFGAVCEVGTERRVDIEFDCSQIPPVTADVLLKFYFDEDNPDTLHCPLQTWMNVNMECHMKDEGVGRAKKIRWKRPDIDGPHKDPKMKKFGKNFSMSVDLEPVL